MERKRAGKGISGFTLVEVIIITALLLFFCTSGISYLVSCREYTLLRMSAQSFSGSLNRARATSIACGIPVEIRLGEDRKSYKLCLCHTSREFAESSLPEDLEFSRIPAKPIIFFNSGTCAPSGSFVISGENASIKVVVSIMGRVRWEFL